MIRKLILCLLLCISSSYADKMYDQYVRDFNKLDSNQLFVLKEIYKRAQPYGLVYSALAIAWQESNFGKWSVNLQDPSCGPFQQSVFHYMRKYKLKITDFNINKVCSELIFNIDLSVATFIAEIESWELVHRKRWNKWDYIYRSYNAGNNWNSETAKIYSQKIRTRIKVLKDLLPDLDSTS